MWAEPGRKAAGEASVSFVIGSDILLHDIEHDLELFSHKSNGIPIGELKTSG